MAGLFAVRALRAGRDKFDPFGECSSGDEEVDALADLQDADDYEEEEQDDSPVVTAPAMKQVASRWEKAAAEQQAKAADASFDVSDEPAPSAAPPKAPPITALNAAWETPCELLYEDDDAEVFCVRFNPDDTLLAAGCGDSVVRIFHCDDGRLAYNLEQEWPKDFSGTRLPTTCLRWKPAAASTGTKNVLLAANADGSIQHWHVTSRKCLHTLKEESESGAKNQVYALDYNPDGTQFASAGKDYAVRVYDEATKTVVSKLASGWVGAPSAGHSNRIFSLKFVPDEPQILLSAGWDNTVQIWDLRTAQPAASIYGPHVCGDGIDCSGNEVVTGSWRATEQLQIWDRRDCSHTVTMPFRPAALDAAAGEACHLYAAQFSKPSSSGAPQLVAAGGSVANELKLFDRATLAPVGRLGLPRGVYGLDFSHSGGHVAVAGGDCKVRVMQVPTAKEASSVAAAAGAAPLSRAASAPLPAQPQEAVVGLD